ncbi:MAG: RNA 2',3'-cyclic phosphodiesterase, partial [Dehalococcoidales bacterium]|nr:RNA 2',3'-cyclic phosphodiesterase [Dehalococcoidales bacterium]
LPGELKDELHQLEARLKSDEQSGVKWVDARSLHITLKFLGNIPQDSIGGITAAMEEAARELSSFQLKIENLGVFPGLQKARVGWVGISGEVEKLVQLRQRIETKLARLGFTSEVRPFTPHLTLARLRDQASPTERQRFGQLITGTDFRANSIIKVDTISLMRSQLTRQGAIYSRIGLSLLKKPLSTTGA